MSRTARLWLFVFGPLIGVIVALIVAAAWWVMGGFPSDHAKYATVAVPGSESVRLPEGEARLYWQAITVGGGDDSSVADRPDGLDVTVADENGTELEVSSVPSWLFSSTNSTTGYEPFGKVDVPAAGSYAVTTGFDDGEVPPAHAAITIGAEPWNPGGSKVAGAVLCFILIFAIAVLPLLIIGAVMRNREDGGGDDQPGSPSVMSVGDAPHTGATAGSTPVPEPETLPDPDADNESDKRYEW